MEKRALGKGLGQLMSGQSVARKPSSPAGPADSVSPKVTPVDFGRGLNALVSTRPAEKEAPAKPAFLLPAWYFFSADLLLLAYTIAICADSDAPLQTGEILFAAGATTFGALLA